ncbi:hypothetical protein ACEPAH_1079 [Sanghuangporus vaninii]
MSRRNRPSAVDLWPDKPAYLTGDQEPIEVEEAPVPAPPPRRQIEDDDDFDDEDEEESDSVERPSRNKNLNPTCVTPLIAKLAQNIYRDLHVARTGPHPKNVDVLKKSSLVSSAEYIEFMDRLLELVHARPFDVSFEDGYRLNRPNYRIRDTFHSAVKVNTLLYRVGDIVIIPAGEDGKHPAPDFPENAPKARPFCFSGDLFWFGRILSIKRDTRSAHVQWLQHASKTILEELAHSQELFLTDTCGDVELSSFLARCRCIKVSSQQRLELHRIDHTEFFYVFSYDQTNGVFRDISEVEENPNGFSRRLGDCGLCASKEEDMERKNEECIRLPHDGGPLVGLERAGVAYHCEDAVLISPATPGPCQIGKITSIIEEDGQFALDVQLFERMNDLIRSKEDLVASQYEERHLFLTEKTLEINSSQVCGKAFVLHKRATKNFRLRGWLDASPNHFYITKTSPSMDRASQGEMAPLSVQDFILCGMCIEEEIDKTHDFLVWREKVKTRPLRIFDPFAGCGAFVLGMCESGTMKFTHAIDIAPSAVETTRRNSPETVVYNQCSNKMLEYAASRMNGSDETLTDLQNDEDLPEPPRREDIDCIVSGFPCQPHSAMNMFQRAHDLLNELFLNTISWVEHLRPKYCLFENVRGFTRHRIGAEQKDNYTVQGGIEQGGIKFVCRALTALGYQVRFAICQAAHYGTPQTRERFFLWAARSGLPLPEFPPPTHYFPLSGSLGIRFTNGDVINPIANEMGPTALPFVTVADAISDLKRWDWVNPHKVYKKGARDRLEEEARRHIVQVRSHPGDESCGIGGVEYEHEPRSAFQARCRGRPAEELQHVTPCLPDEIIERTCNIPVEVGANYKNLNNKPGLWQWQMMDPSSANARKGYKDTMYRRLEADQVFQTTVTNVLPTAKQSKVLNPWCKRMVTVRELARSQGFPDDFLFEAVDGKVRTMHRLIGNAVPWPMSEALGRELEKAWYREMRGQMDEGDNMEY